MGRRDWGGERERERGGEESLGRREKERERGGEERLGRRERWGGEVGRRDGGERWGGEREGERWREGEGSYNTDQRGVRGTVRECVCMWRV